MVKKILVGLLVILIVIQFFRPVKNAGTVQPAHAITAVYTIPDGVEQTLKAACYDCHSNNTRYPWYNNIQPVAWWLANHVKGGKRALNFDEFTTYSLRKQYHKLEEVADQVKEGEMPLGSYTWIHKDAILDEAKKKQLVDWAGAIRSRMEQQYPKDSLVRKK